MKKILLFLVMLSLPLVIAACPNVTGNWVVNGNYTLNTSIDCITITVSDNSILFINNTAAEGVINISSVNLTVEPLGLISADKFGFTSGLGPSSFSGSSTSTPGGGHGGYGGRGAHSPNLFPAPYGNALQPITLGSGGGSGGFGAIGGTGGGAIKITTTNTLTINGNITSNGGPGQQATGQRIGGGGAGGSIWITTKSITGSGAITANGGSVPPLLLAGGGAGGRIAIYYNTSTYNISKTTVTGGLKGGGAGPQKQSNGEPGTIAFIDVDDNTLTVKDGFEFQIDKSYSLVTIFEENTLRGNKTITTPSLKHLTSPNTIKCGITDTLGNTNNNLTFAINSSFIPDNGLKFNISNNISLNTSFINCNYIKTFETSKTSKIFFNNTITSNRNISITNPTDPILNQTNIEAENIIWDSPLAIHLIQSTILANTIIETQNLSIDSQSSISANQKGFTSGLGPSSFCCSSTATPGGGHGGYGGQGGHPPNLFPASYGSALQPITQGSAGGTGSFGAIGGTGGGTIKLNITNKLTINGNITSNAGDGQQATGSRSGGGGAGGSIWITTKTLTGTGTISANGGKGASVHKAGGGSGGRIAIYYNTSTYNISKTSVTGGLKGTGGVTPQTAYNGEVGTIAIIDVDDNTLTIKDGFEFQTNQNYNSITILKSNTIRGNNTVTTPSLKHSTNSNTIACGITDTLGNNNNNITFALNSSFIQDSGTKFNVSNNISLNTSFVNCNYIKTFETSKTSKIFFNNTITSNRNISITNPTDPIFNQTTIEAENIIWCC